MDTDEATADAAAPPSSNDNDADVNMQDAKTSADAPGVENGVPETGDKAEVGTIERNFEVYSHNFFPFFIPFLNFIYLISSLS